MSFLYPVLDSLPFPLQMQVMEYKPRLPKLSVFSLIRNHLNIRYCSTCGEYIDLPVIRGRPPPVHYHYSKYQKRHVYKPRKIRYDIFSPTMEQNLLPPKKGENAMTLRAFYMQQLTDWNTPTTLMMGMTQIRYFFNMKKLLRFQSFKVTPMVNHLLFNIFTNPLFIMQSKFNPIFKRQERYIYLSPKKFIPIMSPTHRNNIVDSLIYLWLIHPVDTFILHPCFFLHEEILYDFLNILPRPIIESLSSDPRFTSSMFMKMLERDISWIDYIPERRLQKLFSEHKRWFIDFYKKHPTSRFYFELLDPLVDTTCLRKW